jgi:hypothetical protein
MNASISLLTASLPSVLLLLLTAGNTRAQTPKTPPHPPSGAVSTPKAPDPAFLNQIYYYWSDSLLACPKMDGQMETKAKAMGFGGTQMGYTMDGGKSPLRIRSADTLRFAVKPGSGGMMDPSTMYKLYKFESKKDSRQAIISNQSRFGGGSSGPRNQISLDVQKSGTDVFILIPSARLAPGEYGFMNMMSGSEGGMGMKMSYTFYTFGIDQ